MCSWPKTLAEIDNTGGLFHAFVEVESRRFYVGTACLPADADAIAAQYLSPSRVVGTCSGAARVTFDGAWSELNEFERTRH